MAKYVDGKTILVAIPNITYKTNIVSVNINEYSTKSKRKWNNREWDFFINGRRLKIDFVSNRLRDIKK